MSVYECTNTLPALINGSEHNYLHPILHAYFRLVLGRITKLNGSALGRFLELLVVYPHPLNNFVQSWATSSMNMV